MATKRKAKKACKSKWTGKKVSCARQAGGQKAWKTMGCATKGRAARGRRAGGRRDSSLKEGDTVLWSDVVRTKSGKPRKDGKRVHYTGVITGFTEFMGSKEAEVSLSTKDGRDVGIRMTIILPLSALSRAGAGSSARGRRAEIKTIGALSSLGADRGWKETVVRGKAALELTGYGDSASIMRDVAEHYGLDLDPEGSPMVSNLRAPKSWGRSARGRRAMQGRPAKRRLDTVSIRYDLSTYMDGWVKDFRPSGPERSEAREETKDAWNYIVSEVADAYGVGTTTIARIGSGMLSEFQQEASDMAAEWYA